MKKGFIAFVKALFGVAKVVLAILGVLVLTGMAANRMFGCEMRL